MNLPVAFDPKAREDVADHAAYLGRRSIERGDVFIDAVRDSVRFLSENPHAGALFELEDEGIPAMRKWYVRGFPKYLVFYRDEGNRILIVRVLHGSSDLPSILSRI